MIAVMGFLVLLLFYLSSIVTGLEPVLFAFLPGVLGGFLVGQDGVLLGEALRS